MPSSRATWAMCLFEGVHRGEPLGVLADAARIPVNESIPVSVSHS